MEGVADILEPLEVHYSDLVFLSSSRIAFPSLSAEDLEKIEYISGAVMSALGPSGPGLLSVTGVPKAPKLRQALLPIARKLALLGSKERTQVLKDNGLGSDVPLKNVDRSVSSFAMLLKYNQSLNLDSRPDPSAIDQEYVFKHIFEELGLCMIELGLRLAQICDNMIDGSQLSKSILESGTSKARLIHYHSGLDNLHLKEERKRTKGSKSSSNSPKDCSTSNLWQQWHFDYGIFTVLTSPLFVSSRGMNDSSCSYQHTCLQLFDANTSRVRSVKAAPESFIIQVGESADVLSNGKLRATLHSVARPSDIAGVSRETFAVFLQPHWDKVLPFPSDLMDAEEGDDEAFTDVFEHEIFTSVSPLSSRLRRGMTFAEFSQETTKKYYGGSGTQSGRR